MMQFNADNDLKERSKILTLSLMLMGLHQRMAYL
jgi:hypothetical protein